MELKNKLSLTREETVDLLEKLAASLKSQGKFELVLTNQEISQEAGDKIDIEMIVSNTRFMLDFKWQEITEETPHVIKDDIDWRKQFDEDMAESGLTIQKDTESPPQIDESPEQMSEVMVPPDVEEVTAAPDASPAPTAGATVSPTLSTITESDLEMLQQEPLKERIFGDRMILETTTLPYDGGVWSPAFTITYKPIWTQIKTNNQLENTKWISEDQLELMMETPRKDRSQLATTTSDEDIFSDLDKKEEISVAVQKQSSISKKPSRQVVTPAAMIHHPQLSNLDLDEDELEEAAATWSEPSRIETSDDEWVQPSKVVGRKSKEDKIDDDTTKGSTGVPKVEIPVNHGDKFQSEIKQWKEPDKEDNATNDDWVKPSEILKKKNQSSLHERPTQSEKIVKQPPNAPDSSKKIPEPTRPEPTRSAIPESKKSKKGKKGKKGKKENEEKDNKKKGWAKW